LKSLRWAIGKSERQAGLQRQSVGWGFEASFAARWGAVEQNFTHFCKGGLSTGGRLWHHRSLLHLPNDVLPLAYYGLDFLQMSVPEGQDAVTLPWAHPRCQLHHRRNLSTTAPPLAPLPRHDVRIMYSISPYKRWGSVAELKCHLQGSNHYGMSFSHKTYRPSPTKDVT
jgi:hypothetical protein